MDYLGAEYSVDKPSKNQSKEMQEVHLSYLKLINVPCLFDVGNIQADPHTDFLTLQMMDSETYRIMKS